MPAPRVSKGKQTRQAAANADYMDRMFGPPQRLPQLAETALGTGASVTLTQANLLNGLLTGNPGGAATYTLPTGANMDAGAPMNVDEAVDVTIVNINGTNAITVATASGWTLVGALGIPLSTSATFRIRKTGAGTFTLFRK